MGMCKECGNVVSTYDMVDGVCKVCLGGDEAIENARLAIEKSKTNDVNVDNYEDKMLEAFVGKPDKYNWYKKSFSKFNVNGMPVMKWNWSWWALFGGTGFLLYRKAYLATLVLLLLTVIFGLIPFVGLIVAILAGGFSTYFVYKKYQKMKAEIEATKDDPQKRLDTMRVIGGYNSWVVWVISIVYILIIIGVIAAVTIPEIQQAVEAEMTEKYIEDEIEQTVENIEIPIPSQTLPFVGKRWFNFFGGNGTGQSITITSNGDTLIEFYGLESSSIEYEGKFKKMMLSAEDDSGYSISGDVIYLYENGKVAMGCKEEGEPCIDTLFEETEN